MGIIIQKNCGLSCLILSLHSILLGNLCCFPPGNGHLASLYDGGETKPPFLQHHRDSRGPMLRSPDRLDVARLPFLRHPSYKHKYLSNQRLLKFHNANAPRTSQLQDADIPSDGSFERFMANMIASGHVKGGNGENSSKQTSTFTPYISTRALSNMEKFFHHLRENLEALQQSDAGDGGSQTGSGNEEEDGSNGSPGEPMASAYKLPAVAEWKPPASGSLGMKKNLRPFFPLIQNPEHRKLGTNFGLGRKRRR